MDSMASSAEFVFVFSSFYEHPAFRCYLCSNLLLCEIRPTEEPWAWYSYCWAGLDDDSKERQGVGLIEDDHCQTISLQNPRCPPIASNFKP